MIPYGFGSLKGLPQWLRKGLKGTLDRAQGPSQVEQGLEVEGAMYVYIYISVCIVFTIVKRRHKGT